ncbi:hypothetical protein CCACVL1_30844 [Corchorus capsularis]|uniref:Uncharacterized protein n=1 Tax=Corchorus capsularis TaxID=210143 RepID=A0A1R3FV85_COCAP|nr:hypothetical protein CCACVL1_30844 [Corchorus capsularis]
MYTTVRAFVAIPRASPYANSKKIAFETTDPAADEAVWVPWPSAVIGEYLRMDFIVSS